MARNMSFSLTTDQIRNKTKTVTRRKGWSTLQPGDELTACVKCMGLKRGEKLQKLARLRVVSVRQEQLADMLRERFYGDYEAVLEGFPKMTGAEFVAMFCKHMGGDENQKVNRIEFEYLPPLDLTVPQAKSTVSLLAEKCGGTWSYDGRRWNCDDGVRWAARTCSCFPDDSDCKCGGTIYVYGDETTQPLSHIRAPAQARSPE